MEQGDGSIAPEMEQRGQSKSPIDRKRNLETDLNLSQNFSFFVHCNQEAYKLHYLCLKITKKQIINTIE